MKLKVKTKDIVPLVRKILNIVSSRTTLPILNNVLLSASSEKLSIAATDLEVSIVATIESDVEEEGQTTVPAKKLGQIINALTGEFIEFNTDSSNTTSISSGKALFKIMGLESSEFPKITELDSEQQVVLNKIELAKTIRKIAYAVSSDQSRMIITGILLSMNEGSITAVATDGRRLTLVEKVLENQDSTLTADIVLPAKVVNELQKLLDEDGDVIIKMTDSHARFEIDDTILTTKLIEGNYPNYRQVIPGSFSNSIIVPREIFSEVLNRVSIVVDDISSSIRFILEKDICTLKASSPEVGEAEESFQLSYQGDPLTISFNPGYLKDPLKNLDCDELTIRFNDEFKPVVILGDEGFLYVIMPMRN